MREVRGGPEAELDMDIDYAVYYSLPTIRCILVFCAANNTGVCSAIHGLIWLYHVPHMPLDRWCGVVFTSLRTRSEIRTAHPDMATAVVTVTEINGYTL